MDDREIVMAIRARLADLVGKDRYEVWFSASAHLAVTAHTLTVTVPSRFFQDWLRSNFRKELEAASAEAAGRPLALEFRVQPSSAERPAAPLDVAPTNEAARNEAPTNGAPTAEPAPALKCNGDGPAHSHGSTDPRRLLPREPARRGCLDTFVVGESNCLAYKAAQMAADAPGNYSPLLVHGPTSVGKTHLLEGILAAFRQAHPRAATVYLSAEQFTTHFLQALHGSGLPSFRRKYRGLDLLAIDDLQFFANKKATLVELQHTVDTLMRAGRQLIFAADRPPSALKVLGPELVARLTGGMVCGIVGPEFATRLGIVRQIAIRLGVALSDDVASYIASHLTTQSRELAGALKRLQATSLAHSRPITLAMAEEALAELIDHQGRIVNLADIEKAVCDVFGVSPASLQSHSKAQSLSHPRMLAMWLARKYTRAALSEIGSYFGRRSHSTVISAQKRVERWMAKGNAVQLDHRSVNLEETLRRVEEQLRAS